LYRHKSCYRYHLIDTGIITFVAVKKIMRQNTTHLTSPREGIPKDSKRLDVDASGIDGSYNILSEKLMGISR
jgi:hypothetical protein